MNTVCELLLRSLLLGTMIALFLHGRSQISHTTLPKREIFFNLFRFGFRNQTHERVAIEILVDNSNSFDDEDLFAKIQLPEEWTNKCIIRQRMDARVQ